MKSGDRVRVIAAFLLILCAADVRSGDEKSFKSEDVYNVTAKVESVDRENRKLMLATSDGRHESFVIGPQVRNFERINAGDQVVVSYRVGLAAEIKPAGTELKRVHGEIGSDRAEAGAVPRVGTQAKLTATVQVESVDAKANTIQFTRANGTTDIVEVKDAKAKELMRKLKPGDKVEVTYTEAMVVSVEPRAP